MKNEKMTLKRLQEWAQAKIDNTAKPDWSYTNKARLCGLERKDDHCCLRSVWLLSTVIEQTVDDYYSNWYSQKREIFC